MGEEYGTAPTTKRSREQACLGNDVNGDGKTGTPKTDLDNDGTGDATMGKTEEVPKDGEKEAEAKNNRTKAAKALLNMNTKSNGGGLYRMIQLAEQLERSNK